MGLSYLWFTNVIKNYRSLCHCLYYQDTRHYWFAWEMSLKETLIVFDILDNYDFLRTINLYYFINKKKGFSVRQNRLNLFFIPIHRLDFFKVFGIFRYLSEIPDIRNLPLGYNNPVF